MGEGNVAVIGFAIGGNEQQVMKLPCGLLSPIGRLPFLDDQRTEDAAKNNNGQTFRLEVNEKDSPWLIGMQGAKLLDLLDLDGGVGVEAKFFRFILESQVVKPFRLNRPFE